METATLEDSFRAALDSDDAGTKLGAVRADREEIEAALKDMCTALSSVMGRENAVVVQPWFTTNEGDGRKVVFRGSDGYELSVFTLSIPFAGYPVTIHIGDETIVAHKGELEADLERAAMRPVVIAAARSIQE